MANLPIPVSEVKSEISTQWNTSNVAEPSFIEEVSGSVSGSGSKISGFLAERE